MSVSAANKMSIIYVINMVSVGVIAYLLLASLDWESAHKLKTIQSFKLKDNVTLKERVEQLYPGGKWTGGELASSYRVGQLVLFWAVERNRVLPATTNTLHRFPEMTPNIDKDVLDSFNEHEPFDPFQYERDHPSQVLLSK